jgi:hypothetical protein
MPFVHDPLVHSAEDPQLLPSGKPEPVPHALLVHDPLAH